MITSCSLCVPIRSTEWHCGIRRAHAFLHCEPNFQARYGAVTIDVVRREIHLSDLIRAHEGNPDYQDDDPSKIHWAKFNMMARFIDVITQCQDGCRASEQFRDLERLRLQEPWYLRWESDTMLMSLEVGLSVFVDAYNLTQHTHQMQRSRIAPPDTDGSYEPSRPHHQSRDAAAIRRIFFW